MRHAQPRGAWCSLGVPACGGASRHCAPTPPDCRQPATQTWQRSPCERCVAGVVTPRTAVARHRRRRAWCGSPERKPSARAPPMLWAASAYGRYHRYIKAVRGPRLHGMSWLLGDPQACHPAARCTIHQSPFVPSYHQRAANMGAVCLALRASTPSHMHTTNSPQNTHPQRGAHPQHGRNWRRR